MLAANGFYETITNSFDPNIAYKSKVNTNGEAVEIFE